MRSNRVVLTFAVAVLAAAGCTSRVPTSYESEFAKPNFMGQCEEGSPKGFCECVWDDLVKTVDWDVYKKFDAAQAAAKTDADIPALPRGIEASVEKCTKKFDGSSDSESTTTTAKSGASSTTTSGKASTSTTLG